MSDSRASNASAYRPMNAKFLADANFDLVILAAARRREPGLDFQTAPDTGLVGMEDPDVLAVAARAGRVLLTHDVRTMPRHFAAFIDEHTSTGVVLIPQSLPRRQVVEDLLLTRRASSLRSQGCPEDPGGTAWIPACAGMTTTRRAPSVHTLEYITRSNTTTGQKSVLTAATCSGLPHVPWQRSEKENSAATPSGNSFVIQSVRCSSRQRSYKP